MNTKQNFNFTATKFDSVVDKKKFYNHFVRFMNSGCKRTLFYKWFYQRLSSTFGHIAHYDRNGFYETFFTCADDRREFIKQCMQYPCYGDPAYTYSDVEKALQLWLSDDL